MTQWILSLGKGARIGFLLSLVWLILVAGISLGIASDNHSHKWGVGFCAVLLLLGVLPVSIGWGIRYIRRAPRL